MKTVPGKEKLGISRYFIIYISQRNSEKRYALTVPPAWLRHLWILLLLNNYETETIVFGHFGVHTSQKLSEALSNLFQLIFAVLQSIKDTNLTAETKYRLN